MPGDEIFDKAKYHYAGKFPVGLPVGQAFVHTGLFVCWLALRGHLSPDSERDFATEILNIRERRNLPCSLYRAMDGVLDENAMGVEGLAFARRYFDFERGRFVRDYRTVFGISDKDFYTIPDTWKSFDLLAPRLDQRFGESPVAS